MIDLKEFLLKYGHDSRTILLFDIFHNQELIMAAIDDLNTAVAALADAVQNQVIPGINALKNQPPPVNNDAAIAAAATTLTSVTNALVAAVAPPPAG